MSATAELNAGRLLNLGRWYVPQQIQARPVGHRAGGEASCGRGRAVFDVVRATDGTSDWHLVGELDLATAGDLSTVVLPWLEERPHGGTVTFDASELTFIDSTGVRTLYSLTGPPHEPRVILRNPTEAVWGALAMIGLSSDLNEAPGDVAIERVHPRGSMGSQVYARHRCNGSSRSWSGFGHGSLATQTTIPNRPQHAPFSSGRPHGQGGAGG